MHRGYFALWRKVQDHPFYKEKRVFSKYEAWLDLLMNVQHQMKPKDVCFGMTILTQQYGETLKSVRAWGRRWSWGESKVTRFLKLLEKLNQIELKSEGITTRIRVLNYKQYDPKRNTSGGSLVQERNSSDTRAGTNKNDNNIKNVKNEKETSDLSPENPQQIIDQSIAHLNIKAGVRFNPDIYATQTLLIDRINEGFTIDDFKAVIDKKCSQWLNDARMVGNLRPGTLFAADKFEGYLQEAKRNGNKARPTKPRKLTAIELMTLGQDVLTKFGEDKFKEFCALNKMTDNDVVAIRRRAGCDP